MSQAGEPGHAGRGSAGCDPLQQAWGLGAVWNCQFLAREVCSSYRKMETGRCSFWLDYLHRSDLFSPRNFLTLGVPPHSARLQTPQHQKY